MNKILFNLSICLLIIGSTAQIQATDYSEEGTLKLEANILNLGYSPDQRTLVVLTNGAEGKFTIFEGIKSNVPRTIDIIDGTLTISPSVFAFASDNSMLIVGSKEGSVYGFAFDNNGKVQQQYKYKYNIQTDVEYEIYSIKISAGKKIAVGAGQKLVVLQLPADASNQFKLVNQFPYNTQVSSVAWKNDDQNSILVGCLGINGRVEIYDIAGNTSTPAIPKSTSSLGVFKDGRVLQGKVLEDIQIWKWNDTTTAYESLGPIADTLYATEIILDSNSLYFGAEIKSTATVRAWQIDALTEKNLKNSQVLTVPTPLLNQPGTNLALSGRGDQILVVTDATDTVKRFDLCKDGSYYDNGNCLACVNGCKNCFDDKTCLTCPAQFYITADDKCATCHNIIPGCKDCDNQNTCNLCDADLNRKQVVQGGACVCNDISYDLNDLCNLCIDSIDFCETCSDKDTCKTCYPDGNINPLAQNGKCLCLAGWYLKDKTCKDCPIAITGCKFCDDEKTCTQCNADGKFESDGKGGCQCIDGNWYNPATLLCQLCETSVTGCLKCSQDGKCDVCSQEKRIPSADKTQCICEPHTFQNPQKLCQDCDPYRQCLQCAVVQPNACTKCDTTKGRTQKPVNGVCQCNRGYIENTDSHDCIACTVPGCQQCDIAQTCDICFAEKHFKQTPENGVCVCDTDYHLVDNKTECWTCDQSLTGCLTCDNLKQCKQCDTSSDFQLNQTSKLCQCKASFFEQNKKCKICSEQFDFCQNCNKDQCETCQNGFSFNDDEKKCFCPSDRDFDETAKSCEQKAGLSALAIIAIIVGILALAGGAVALIKCFKKRQSPLEDGEYEALEGKDK